MKHFETTVIKEGVRIHFLPDYKFKTFRISAFFHCPLKKETASFNALLPSVLKRGTKRFPSSQELSMELETLYGASLGGGVSKCGDSHVISFHFEGVSSEFLPEEKDMFQTGAELLFELLFHPNCDGAFPEDIVSQEKENLKKDIEGILNDKRGYAVLRTVQEMFQGEPYGIPTLGSIEEVEKISGELLYKHYEEVLKESPVDLYVLGNFNPQTAMSQLSDLCENFSERSGMIPKSTLASAVVPEKEITESMNIVQGKLVMGFTTGVGSEDEAYFPLLVANSIFGSGTHSKLFNNVREKMSLAYYVTSRLDKMKGLMLVDSGIEFSNYEKAVSEIRYQLQEVQKGNITEVEFSSAVEGLCNAYRSMKDSMQGMEQFYFGQLHQEKIYSPDEAVDKLREVTLEQVIESVQNIRCSIVYFLKN